MYSYLCRPNSCIMNKPKHIFFDLDRTLWDFESSANEAFRRIFHNFGLGKRGVESHEKFHKVYTVHNNRLWDSYRKGEITKEDLRGRRFNETLYSFNIVDTQLGDRIGDEYIRISPLIVRLFPNAINILEYLSSRGYILHIITNGFEEVQTVKLRESKMRGYFKHVVTSEEAGVKKPDPVIFNYAFDKTGALPSESIMIGDDFEVDIEGARNVGMKTIFFDPESLHTDPVCDFHIQNLKEIEGIL